MRHYAFEKYEGLGNDFVVVRGGATSLDDVDVRSICDRHFGVGADGVLLVGPPRSEGAAASMVVRNADGSRPEMCGNGLRCVALFVASSMGESSLSLGIDTDAGLLGCAIDAPLVTIDMGTLVDEGATSLDVAGRTLALARASIGNPHAITFEPHDDDAIDAVGPAVATHAAFAKGTNVEFARLADDGAIDLVVWERGVGRTLACGTGACATAFAACLAGARAFGEWIVVRLPGGELEVRVDKGTYRAHMRGPAKRVFRGELELPPSRSLPPSMPPPRSVRP